MSKTTIADVALKAGVSKMTVSRVINNDSYVAKETKSKILRIMEELDFYPNLIAKNLSIRKSNALGIAIPKTNKLFFDNYISQLLAGITDAAQSYNQTLSLIPVDYHQFHKNLYSNIIRSRLVDGLILIKSKIDDPGLEPLQLSKLPFVLVNHRKTGDFNYIDSENHNGARQAIEYLFQKGYRRIAFISGDEKETNAIDRFEGYKDALNQLGLEYHPAHIVAGNFDQEQSMIAANQLIKTNPMPDAIFAADDYSAIAAMKVLKENGIKIPEDIALIGFDDIEIASYVQPALTTVRQPIYEIGKIAVESLMKIVASQEQKVVQKSLPVELVIRQSA